MFSMIVWRAAGIMSRKPWRKIAHAAIAADRLMAIGVHETGGGYTKSKTAAAIGGTGTRSSASI